MEWQRWEHMMARQWGMLAARQALTDSEARALRRVAADHGWERPLRGVVAMPWPDDPRRRLAAALLGVGGPAALTGRSALWHRGLIRGLPTCAEILVDHGRRNRRLKYARVVRTRHLAAAGIEVVDGLPSVSVAWSITDLARWHAVPVIRGVVIDARQRGLLDPQGLPALLDVRGPIIGAGRVRQVVEELRPSVCDSMLEYHIRGRLAQDPVLPAPDPAPVPVRATDGRVVHIDVGWRSFLVGIECLGMSAHSSRTQLDRDVIRDNAVEGTPWKVFRATWAHADDDEAWAVLARQLGAELSRA